MRQHGANMAPTFFCHEFTKSIPCRPRSVRPSTCLGTIGVISDHVKLSRTPLMTSRRLHLDPVDGIIIRGNLALPRLDFVGWQIGPVSPPLIYRKLGWVETPRGHQRSARGLGMVRDDSNGPRHVPGHVGMLSTGHHGSHAISTGHVTGERETPVYSPERTI